jgi:predicted nucleotide-binding protein (sugar kinase/HSP70/actin superfamily)
VNEVLSYPKMFCITTEGLMITVDIYLKALGFHDLNHDENEINVYSKFKSHFTSNKNKTFEDILREEPNELFCAQIKDWVDYLCKKNIWTKPV